MNSLRHVIEVWGDFACFSRPELKIERFSYPVMTPSAARGILDAIFARPHATDPKQIEFCWRVSQIDVLEPIAYIALRRNEVKDVANCNAIEDWMDGKKEPEPIWADGDKNSLGTDSKGRTQRQTMALKKIRYRIHAQIQPWPGHESKLNSLEEQFKRRVEGGKCFHQPCMGVREFPAYFKFAADTTTTAAINQQLGYMLYDVFDLSRPGGCNDRPYISLFKAELKNGVMKVPEYSSTDVLKPQRS